MRHRLPGIYELLRGADAAYVSADGKYAIIGDLYRDRLPTMT